MSNATVPETQWGHYRPSFPAALCIAALRGRIARGAIKKPVRQLLARISPQYDVEVDGLKLRCRVNDNYTEQMALEWGAHRIRANAVGPGLIVTEGTQANYQGERRKERAKGIPLARVGEPEDIADVIAFLCSDDARYVSGQVIYIDGGVTAGRTSL